jgi:hypothetical protein
MAGLKGAGARGALVARALNGAWRLPPSPPDLSGEELDGVASLLHGSGAASLVSWRLGAGEDTPDRAGFRQAYRLHTLEAALHRQRIRKALATLREAGLDPVLAKGWAAARLYPEEGLRPYCDLDLYLSPEEFEVAARLGPRLAEIGCPVDLHRGFGRLRDVSEEALLARSRLVPLEGLEVRVLGPEDHLRLLSLHMLGHGAWRPLWLVDLAVAVESPPALDWDRLLSGSARPVEWVASALLLARELLGARLKDAPSRLREKRLPSWLLPTVLRAWGQITRETPQGARRPLSDSLFREGLFHALRVRWPNPIEATIGVGGPFNELPRLPFQIGECLSRSARFAWHLPRSWRARPRDGVASLR